MTCPDCVAGICEDGSDCESCGATSLSAAERNAALAAKTSDGPVVPPTTVSSGSSPGGVGEEINRPPRQASNQETLMHTSIAGVLCGVAWYLMPKWAARRATKRREERHFARTWPAALRGDQGHEHHERP